MFTKAQQYRDDEEEMESDHQQAYNNNAENDEKFIEYRVRAWESVLLHMKLLTIILISILLTIVLFYFFF